MGQAVGVDVEEEFGAESASGVSEFTHGKCHIQESEIKMTEEPSDVLGSEDRGKPVGRLRAGQAVSRGIRLRCPSCGKTPLFRTWFRMWEACGECGLKFERAPGYFLGSTYINYGVTALLTTIVFVVLRFGFGVPREVILPGSLAFCLIFPLVFFRFARSLWLSIDLSLDWQRSEDSGM